MQITLDFQLSCGGFENTDLGCFLFPQTISKQIRQIQHASLPPSICLIIGSRKKNFIFKIGNS